MSAYYVRMVGGIEFQRSDDFAFNADMITYRDARIECMVGGHVCALFLEGHPVLGQTFGAPGTITSLVDQWAEGKWLPGHMKAVPK